MSKQQRKEYGRKQEINNRNESVSKVDDGWLGELRSMPGS